MTGRPGAENRLAFQYVLRSTPEAVRDTLTNLRNELENNRFQTCPGDMWEVVLAEILNNIVEHAYDERSDGEIRFNVDFRPGALSAHFVDCGSKMPHGVLPEGKPANLEVEVDDLPEGGFGWFLIQTLCDQLTYERRGSENHLSLKMAVQLANDCPDI